MKGGYFLLNGRFHREDDTVFTLSDLADRVNGFSTSFRAEHNEVLFPESICNYLLAAAQSTGLDLNGLIDQEGRLLRKDVSRLLNKNKLYLAAKVGIQVYPSSERINIALNAVEINRGYFPLGETGLLISSCRDILSGSAYRNPRPMMEQSTWRLPEDQIWPDGLQMIQEGRINESISCPFACIVADRVFFLTEVAGGYGCAIRKEVMQSVREAGMVPVEKDEITPEELLSAEELFLFDAFNGIQKVLGLEDKRYFSTKTKLVAGKLSELARRDRERKG